MKTHVTPFSSAALALLFAAAVPMLSSCSKSDADAGAAAAAEAAAPARSPAEDCLATANAARTALLAGRLADVHDMMPASWQKDVDGLLSLLATKVDKQTFSQVTGLAGDLASLAEEKSDLIREWLAKELVVNSDGSHVTKDNVAALGRALRALSAWKYEDLSEGRFRALFGDAGLSEVLALVIAESMADEKASCSEFSLVDPSQTDKVALSIELTSRDWSYDEETGAVGEGVKTEQETLEWVRFEDCWVPDPLLNPGEDDEGWARGIANARESIEEISPAEVGQLSMGLTMIRMVVPMIKQCESVEDLQQVFRNFR